MILLKTVNKKKMKITVLEYEVEYMTEFSFLGELSHLESYLYFCRPAQSELTYFSFHLYESGCILWISVL